MVEHVHHHEPECKPGSAATEEETGGIGEQLRKQRKARGISMVEVAEHTKVGKKYLEALENEDYDVLPGETYTCGFLRAYAKYLELDDEELLRRYKSERYATPVKNECDDKAVPGDKGENNQTLWGPLLAVLVLAGMGAGVFLLWPASKNKVESKTELPEMLLPNLAAGHPSGTGAALGNDLTLKVRAKERSWITLMIDGRQEPDVTLNANEERTWTAKDRFVLWTGNAGGVEVTFNGQPQPALGKQGEVRKEVVFERKAESAAPVAVPTVQ